MPCCSFSGHGRLARSYHCGGSCVLYEWAGRGALDMCGFTILGVDLVFFT